VLTAEFLQEAYVDEGQTMQQIAGLVGCSNSTVLRALRRHGIPTRPPARGGAVIYTVPITTDRTDAEVAVEVGTVRSTVTRARLRADAKRPLGQAPRMSDKVLAEADQRVRSGESWALVAESYGLSRQVLWNRVNRWRRR
jgi:transposase-like protein